MSRKTKVVVISGYAQHGKDTFGRFVETYLKNCNKTVLVGHYADLLKYICKSIFDWDGNKDQKGRELLQYVGTDVIRKKNPDYWVDFFIGLLDMFDGKWDFVIIPDCRFPNEISKMKDAGFDVTHVRVFRVNFDNGLTDEQKNHISEVALDDTAPDCFAFNILGLDILEAVARKFVDYYLLKGD